MGIWSGFASGPAGPTQTKADLRRELHKYQRKITFGRGYPAGMKDGDLQVRMVPGKGPVLFAKIGALMVEWLGKWQREVPEKKVYRQLLLFGHNWGLSRTTPGITTDEMRTIDGATNREGYRMIRNGRCVGLSFLCMCNDVGPGMVTVTVQKNGVDQSMAKATALPEGLEVFGASTAGNLFSFANNDNLTCIVALQQDSDDTTAFIDLSVVVEIEVSERKP